MDMERHQRRSREVDYSDERPLSASPVNRRRDRRKSKSRELLGTSAFHDEHMEEGAEVDVLEGTEHVAPEVRAALGMRKAGEHTFRKDVAVWAVAGEVSITKQGLNDKDTDAIAALLEDEYETPIVKLNLANNQLGDEAAVEIATKLQSNPHLTWLSLHNNRIGNAGGKMIAQALSKGAPALTTLFLSQNDDISDQVRDSILAANNKRKPKPLGGLNGLVM